MVLAGVLIPAELGPVAHSDGDAVFHALTDAMLGALGLPDIGELFPDDAPANLGRASVEFVRAACERASAMGWSVGNVDVVVRLERPVLAPFKPQLRSGLARALGVDESRVNIKARRGEGVGPVGLGQAIETLAVVLLVRG